MNSFTLRQTNHRDFAVIEVEGYYAAEAGQETKTIVAELLANDRINIIMDFSACRLINSPGVVAIMQVAMEVVEDFGGKLVLVGLDDLKVTVLEMAGVIPLADNAKDLDQAAMILA